MQTYTRDPCSRIKLRTHITSAYHKLERKLPQKLIRHIKDQQLQMFEVTSPNSNPTGVKKIHFHAVKIHRQ